MNLRKLNQLFSKLFPVIFLSIPILAITSSRLVANTPMTCGSGVGQTPCPSPSPSPTPPLSDSTLSINQTNLTPGQLVAGAQFSMALFVGRVQIPTPQAGNTSATTPMNTPVSVTVPVNNPSGHTLAYSILVAPPANSGTATIDSAGVLTFTPNPGFGGGQVKIAYLAADNTYVVGDAGIVTINVTGGSPNSPPVINPVSPFTAQFNGPGVDVSATGSDPNGDPITWSRTASAFPRGTLSGTPPSGTYTPTTNMSGADSFLLEAATPDGQNDMAKVNGSIAYPSVGTVNVTYGSPNGPIVGTTGGSYGAGSVNVNTSGLPQGPGQFFFQTSDAAGGTAMGSVNLNVDSLPPSCTYKTPDTPVEGAWVRGTISFTVTSIDPSPGSGVAGVNLVDPIKPPEKLYKYLPINGTPDWQYNNYDTRQLPDGLQPFDSECYDVAGNVSNPRIRRNVNVDNTPPTGTIVLSPPSAPYNNRTSTDQLVRGVETVTVTGDDHGGSGVALIVLLLDGVQIASSTTSSLTANLNTAAYADGNHTLTTTVTDAVGNAGTFSMVLKFDNTPPSVTITSPTDGATVTGSFSQIQATISDANGIGSITVSVDGTSVSFTQSNSGSNYTFTLTNPINSNGTHTIQVAATDTVGNQGSDTHTIILVGGANHLPVAYNRSASTTQGTAKTVRMLATDADNDPLTYIIVSGPANGSLSSQNGPNITYTPTGNFTGSDSFTYKANDGKGDSNVATFSLTVSAADANAPTVQDLSVTVNENSSVGITLLGQDPNNKPLTYSIIDPPVHGQLTGTAPNLTYTPAQNYTGADTFTYKANHGTLDSNTGTVSISVGPVPTVQFVLSKNGSSISGQQTLKVVASNATSVVFSINNGPNQTATAGPGGVYTLTLDTTQLPEGSTTIKATASNGSLNTSATITVMVDNTSPTIASFTPADGSVVSGNATLQGSASDNQGLSKIEIYVEGTLVASVSPGGATSGNISYSWDTTSVANGSRVAQIRAVDLAGNVRTQSNNLTVQNSSSSGSLPQITILTPTNGSAIGAITPLRMSVTGTVLSAGFKIDGGPFIPATQSSTNPDQYSYNLDTTQYAEGHHVIDFIAANSAGSVFKTINVFIDNTPPTITLQKPLANATLYLVQNIIADASDSSGLPLASVRFNINASPLAFFPRNPVPGSTLYTYALDTEAENANGNRIYVDGQQYTIDAIATDQAGNQALVRIPVTIDNRNVPLSNATITWTPSVPFAVGPIDTTVSATITNGSFDPAAVGPSALRIYLTKDGEVNKRWTGPVQLVGNTLKFLGTIPYNARVHCVLDALDIAGKVVRQTNDFISAMDHTLGGKVTILPEGLLTMTVPSGALKQDALVEMTKVDPNSQLVLDADRASAGFFQQPQDVVYGPVDVTETYANGSQNTTLASPCQMLFSRDTSNIPPNRQSGYVDEAQQLDNKRIWRSLGTSGSPLTSNGVGARTIAVPVEQFGLFRITSFPAPGPGITDLFNYPNPFTPAEGGTDIQYMLGDDSDVNFVIYDLLGNLVKRLDIASGNAGGKVAQNIIHWDGTNGAGDVVGNGGYIVQITAKDSNGSVTRARRKIGVVK